MIPLTPDTAPLDQAGTVLPNEPAAAPPAPKPRRAHRATTGAAKKAAAKKDDSKPKAGRPTVNAQLRDSLDEMITSIGLGVSLANEADGVAIIEGGPKLADALAALAASNPRIAKALTRTTGAAGWGGVVIALSGILVPIAANHGLVPGLVPPAVDGPDPLAGMPSPIRAMAEQIANDPAKLASLLGGLGGSPT